MVRTYLTCFPIYPPAPAPGPGPSLARSISSQGRDYLDRICCDIISAQVGQGSMGTVPCPASRCPARVHMRGFRALHFDSRKPSTPCLQGLGIGYGGAIDGLRSGRREGPSSPPPRRASPPPPAPVKVSGSRTGTDVLTLYALLRQRLGASSRAHCLARVQASPIQALTLILPACPLPPFPPPGLPTTLIPSPAVPLLLLPALLPQRQPPAGGAVRPDQQGHPGGWVAPGTGEPMTHTARGGQGVHDTSSCRGDT